MKKKLIAFLLSMTLILGVGMPVHADGVDPNANGQAYLVFGADLSRDQYEKVLSYLDVTEEDVADYVTLEVTNEEEHKYLDEYLDSSVIGSKAFSSLKLIPEEEGAGISIETTNITYCTVEMYQNALITAGMKDASLTIAGPFELSGTAALIGAVKAYADMNGEEVDEEALETATNELVLTGELMEDSEGEGVSEMMAYVKQLVVENDLESEEDIKDAVVDACDEFNLELSDEQINDVVKLMQKVSKLDIDANALEEQAQSMYNKLKDMGIDLGKVDTNSIVDFIQRFFDKIVAFFNSLIG